MLSHSSETSTRHWAGRRGPQSHQNLQVRDSRSITTPLLADGCVTSRKCGCERAAETWFKLRLNRRFASGNPRMIFTDTDDFHDIDQYVVEIRY